MSDLTSDDIYAAIQAAVLADNWVLAVALAKRHGVDLDSQCLQCGSSTNANRRSVIRAEHKDAMRTYYGYVGYVCVVCVGDSPGDPAIILTAPALVEAHV